MGEIILGIGEAKVTNMGVIGALGLGSCVGLILYDSSTKIGGMVHIMLPDSSNERREIPKKTILLAENSSFNNQKIKEILLSAEFEILGDVNDLNHAVRLYKELKPSVALISFDLLNESYQTALKNMSTNATSKLIILGKVYSHAIQECLDLGADDLILDPITDFKVKSIINSNYSSISFRYADKAVELLYNEMIAKGANKSTIVAKLVGGAHMFSSITKGELVQIGKKNIEATKEELARLNIRLVAEDTGEDLGRSVRLNVETGEVVLRTKNGEKSL